MRTFYMMAATLAIAVAPLGQSARAQHEHAEHFTKCAKVCADCGIQCDSCFKHCLTLTADGKKEHAKTAQLRRVLQGVFNSMRPAESAFPAHAGVLRELLRRVRHGLREEPGRQAHGSLRQVVS
jgi:hypothetical protein